MWHRRWRFVGFPFRTYWGPWGFGLYIGPRPFFRRPFPRREDYIRWLEDYRRDLEEYKREVEEEIREVERELADLRREGEP